MSKRVEQVVSSRSPQTNSSFYRMIAAHGEGVLVDSFMIKRPSVGQRMAMGKGLRKQVPRAAQAIYNKAADRPDPVEILESTERDARPKARADLLWPYARQPVCIPSGFGGDHG